VIETSDTVTDRSREERIREMNELLQELRVILPGVQVLFAFLLTVAFTQRFTEISSYQKNIYFTALMSTAFATVFFIAPTSQHRLLWRQHARSQRLWLANWLLIVGSVFLAVGVSCVVFLVADFIYGSTTAAVATALVAGAVLVLWYLLPLVQRLLK
jgi:magnesium-transporting ATPase (P-type)